MNSRYSKFLWLIQFIGDVSLLNFAFFASYLFSAQTPPFSQIQDHYITLHIIFNMAWIILAFTFNIYIYSTVRRRKLEIVVWNLVKILTLHVLIIFTFIGALKESFYSRQMILITYIILGAGIFTWRVIFILLLNWYRRNGSNYRNVLIIGAGPVGLQVMRYVVSQDNAGYKFIGFLDDAIQHVKHKELVLGKVDDLETICKGGKVDEIFCTLPFTSSKKIRSIIEYGDIHLPEPSL